ncbi:MAG: endopeptidase La [Acholeplasmatales bacterium]|jgi:ATP-dependent Lon protease|nr:endopeptidase La [Acholeplasmatales bacterium]
MSIHTYLPAVFLSEVILPSTECRITSTNLTSSKKTPYYCFEEAEFNHESLILLCFNNNNEATNNISEFAVLARILSKTKQPMGSVIYRLQTLTRVKLGQMTEVSDNYFFEYVDLEDFHTSYQEEIKAMEMIFKSLNPDKFTQPKLMYQTEQLKLTMDPSKFSDICAMNLNINPKEKISYLEEINVFQRLLMVLQDIKKLDLDKDVEKKINDELNKTLAENQKEYVLREKMKIIQNELGQKAKKESEIEEYREKILKCKMPPLIEEKALLTLSRYEMAGNFSGENGMLANYLDFMISLPWSNYSCDNNDIEDVSRILDKNHYGLNKVKQRIIEYLAVKILTGRNPQTILCLVGPPGVGKTTLAISIAEALGRKFVKQSLGGLSDEAEIRGHRRTYIGALPGRILKGMVDAKTVNPLFLLDEIDKMTQNFRGDPASAMLEVLDPEQNAHFSDNYLEEPYDLSQVLFITTANELDKIPETLRDRMEIIHLSSYTEQEKVEIAKSHIVNKQLAIHGLESDKFEITDGALYALIRGYTREAGVREVNRYIGTLVRKSIRKILSDKELKVVINESNLEDYLGKNLFDFTGNEHKDQVGVATGLAYTQYGGDTLPVEATYYLGTGKLMLTGKLGDVMVESAQAATSYIKSHMEEYKIEPNFFNTHDLHIHVPEGAVPKDGPSAGITIATALLSAITKRYIKKDLGMTGEITLRGNVLPIGGLKEKSIAALRSGLKQILVPKDNMRDLDDLPQEVKDNLIITPVEFVNEVFNLALLQ